MATLNQFQIAGLLTHAFVLLLGLGGLVGVVPLARGRRGGLGLVLMAVAMAVVVLEPLLRLGAMGVTAYVVGFLAGLWLLLGPDRIGVRVPARADDGLTLARGGQRQNRAEPALGKVVDPFCGTKPVAAGHSRQSYLRPAQATRITAIRPDS